MSKATTSAFHKTEQIFTISIFSRKSDATPKESHETWAQIVKRFSAFKIRTEKDGPLFSPAKFSPLHRAKDNVTELSFLVLDYDHNTTIDEAVETWGRLGVRFLLYTTHSHQRVTINHSQAEDRFRVVLPLREPIPANEFPRLWQWANSLSNGKLDPTCKDASHMYYLPAKASKDSPSEFKSVEGDLFDWQKIELREADISTVKDSAKLSRYATAALNGEAARVLSAPPGARNDSLNRAAYYLGRLVGGGVVEQGEAESVLSIAALQAGLEKRETKATINSGLKAGARNPRTPQHVNNGNASSNQAKAKDNSPTTDKNERANTYESTDKGLVYWQQTMQGVVPLSLSNFGAEIISDVIEDDGTETKRAFEISARLNDRPSKFLVSAEDFAAMKWPMINLGAKAVIYPRRTDHARCAIQMLSPAPTERRIFTHTGWREIDGERFYLHGGGAIGAQLVKDVEVRLPESLSPVVLPEPPNGDELKKAVDAILDLTRLASDEITLPTIGSAFSSVIGGADFSMWLYGVTDCGKSQLGALIQSFFGPFTAEKLPGSWMSTANALEGIAHSAKDMVFVVDDFKPTGGANDRARLMKDADRLLRAQGNQHGRQRLAADTTQRKTKYPRGLIFNTAEEVPKGESLIARLFVIETQKTSIDFSQLSKFQKLASDGVFASGMSAFIRWLASNYTETIEGAPKEIAKWRDHWTGRQIAGHRRYATTLGHLTYAWSLWLRAMRNAGAMTDKDAQDVWGRVLFALGMAGSKQDAHSSAQNPVIRFLELLQSAFASNKAHLENIGGGSPINAEAWGWRRVGTEMQPCGDRIGWHTGDEIYLLPDATFALLERYSANGEGIGVQQETLWKHLSESGILTRGNRERARQTFKTQRKISGQQFNILLFRAETLYMQTDKTDNTDIDGG